jgi:hypothetical protein
MSRTGKVSAPRFALCGISRLLRVAILGVMVVAVAPSHGQAQQPAASSRVIGTVASVSGNTVSVKTDAGATTAVTVPDTARIVRTAPGSKTLTGATKIAVSDIGPGDRVLMAVAGDPPSATIVIVNKQSDIAAKQQQEQADWARRGVGGLVNSVDAATPQTPSISATRNPPRSRLSSPAIRSRPAVTARATTSPPTKLSPAPSATSPEP